MKWAGAALAALLSANLAGAVCEFDGSGTISNPDDPACRDTQLTFTDSVFGDSRIALGYPVPVPVDSLTAIDGFRSYASLHARHKDLMMTSPTVAGEIVGHTHAGREIWAYVLGDADSVTDDGLSEAAVIVNGGIHAREWQSPEVLTEILEQLAELADDTGIGAYLATNLNVVLIPVLNIDGFLQTQRFADRATADIRQPRDGRMRRKNMRHPVAVAVDDDILTTDDNFFGIDLNRNNAHGFAQNAGSSDNAVSLIYRGTAPGSEPEIEALRAATLLGPRSRLRLGIDVHSFGAVYFTPRTGNARRNAITQSLAERMRAVTAFKYRYSPDAPGSGGIGTVADYFAYEFQVPSWTLETEPLNGGQDYGGTGASHSGFVLPDSQIARTRDELARTLLLGFYRQAGPPYLRAVQIIDEDSAETVYDARWTDAGDSRELVNDVDRALVPGRRYRLWAGFSKPMRWADETGTLRNYAGQLAPPVSVAFSSADAGASFRFDVNITTADWLTVAGGAPDGYQRYRGDAFAVAFTVPTNLGVTAAAAVSVQFDVGDIAQMTLDADPSTPVDWVDGHWSGYADTALNDADVGGADCTHVAFVATDADATAPDKTAVCPAFAAATAPPPVPPAPPPAPPQGGGGGGAPGWLLIVASLLVARRRTGA